MSSVNLNEEGGKKGKRKKKQGKRVKDGIPTDNFNH